MAKNGFSMSNRVAVKSVTAAQDSLTVDDCGKIVILDRATGASVSLPASPAAAGAGWNVTFLVETDLSSGNYKIAATNGDFFIGALASVSEAGAADMFPANGTSEDEITMNGAATGGNKGTRIEIYSDGSSWHINGTLACTGSPTTPWTTG